MGRPKKPPKPPSAHQLLVQERAARRAARQARQSEEAEKAFQKLIKRQAKARHAAEVAKRKAEIVERRKNRDDRSAYLEECRRMLIEDPVRLLEQTLKLRDLAKGRAEYLTEFARQTKANSDPNEPEELEECKIAEARAKEARGEYHGLRVRCITYQKVVDRRLAESELARQAIRDDT